MLAAVVRAHAGSTSCSYCLQQRCSCFCAKAVWGLASRRTHSTYASTACFTAQAAASQHVTLKRPCWVSRMAPTPGEGWRLTGINRDQVGGREGEGGAGC